MRAKRRTLFGLSLFVDIGDAEMRSGISSIPWPPSVEIVALIVDIAIDNVRGDLTR